MGEDLPLVRLRTDGQWAVCCSIECGTRFARRISLAALTDGSNASAVLDFGPGWVVDSQSASLPVWHMSRRAFRRQSEGRQPGFRRQPFRDLAGWLNREDSQGGNPRNRPRDRSYRPSSHSSNAHVLPALVICPKCGRRQLADAATLRCG
jgi:hypothetical protein